MAKLVGLRMLRSCGIQAFSVSRAYEAWHPGACRLKSSEVLGVRRASHRLEESLQGGAISQTQVGACRS